MFASRPALRWVVPAGVLAATFAIGLGGSLLNADAAGSLPPRTAGQLLVDVQEAAVDGFSGTVVQRADLGIPALPSIQGGGPMGGGDTELQSLVSGSHTLRVWYGGPTKTRIALLGTLGESDIINNGRDVWTWSSRENAATHIRLPASPDKAKDKQDLPTDLPKTPQEAAERTLAALDPTTKVTTSGTGRVAGRDVYELILTPRDTSSLVGQIRLALDGENKIPLRVQVFPKSSGEPAFEVAFTQVSFVQPGEEQFTFKPPAGVKVTEETAPSDTGKREHATPEKPEKQGPPDGMRVIGKGWTSVLVAKTGSTPSASGGDGPEDALGGYLTSLPRASGSWGSGYLLKGKLFTALLTDDGRLVAGLVTPERLYAVAAQK
ncbi:LolA family protein [Tenggerimyces flavus]|uniref:Outer membrane lipoprotein carrier protein LolA n=1 Tax=Tenggerimyces flavus TaxID=1708749 RepID=A0ABV7YGC8_9ACTN|nr:sigma-E factor regulatory protein RseB domain-containing protein [Tenggerimyces flavus]MBM7784528.1 outer membrane lipoprotein-sorting protein [Tenggerimyces flavus]